MLLMGLDMGTSGCKAVVFDEKWNTVCAAYREYNLSFAGEGLLELDPEIVWDNIKQVIREVNEAASQPIDALAISAIGDVIIPLYKDGIPVRNSIVDFDPRGMGEIKRFTDDFGVEDFFRITGMPPLFIGSLAKILWLKENEKESFEKVERWGTYEDYIIQKLGLSPSVSYSEAARTMLFDIRKKIWAKEILAKIPIDEGMLPKLVKSGEKLGKVDSALAKELGFKGRVIVVSGGHDMVCAAVGAGLDEHMSETAVNIAGTIEGVVAAMDKANTGKTMLNNLFPCYPGFDGYVTFSVNLTAGCIVRWYRDVIAKDTYEKCTMNKENFYNKMLESVNIKTPGGMYLIPHFSGSGNPFFNPLAKGIIYGLTLDTAREDIVQTMIEGLCFELRLHTEALNKAGIRIETLRAVGGGARIDKQLQLKANITGLNVIKGNVPESSALGAASFAGFAMGIIKHPSEAFAAITKEEKNFVPHDEAHGNFESAYKRYKALSEKINEFETQIN